MKWHISSWLFTKLDDFLPYVYYSDLSITKNCVFWWYTTVENGNLIWFDFFLITEPCRDNLKLWILIKRGYHIVPSPSTALLKIKEFTYRNSWKIPIGNTRWNWNSFGILPDFSCHLLLWKNTYIIHKNIFSTKLVYW